MSGVVWVSAYHHRQILRKYIWIKRDGKKCSTCKHADRNRYTNKIVYIEERRTWKKLYKMQSRTSYSSSSTQKITNGDSVLYYYRTDCKYEVYLRWWHVLVVISSIRKTLQEKKFQTSKETTSTQNENSCKRLHLKQKKVTKLFDFEAVKMDLKNKKIL